LIGLKKNSRDKNVSSPVFADQLSDKKSKKRFYKKTWFKLLMGLGFLTILVTGAVAWKTGYILNKISQSDNSTLRSLINVLPIIGDNELKATEDGRTNILLLGMRGQNVPGGGLLADSIIVLSLKKDENKVAMLSIPRDLYVKVPGSDSHSKINSVYAYGEEKGGKGLEQMSQIVGDVTGLKIHYAVAINFIGFKQLIDAVGGIDVYLETPFYETHQFVEGNECGGEFTLPAGLNHLDGEKALCYARARDNTSDFDRSKRQQLMIKALKDKLMSLGTLTDFSKLGAILDAVGENLKTNMASFEMKKFYEDYVSLSGAEIYQRVFENSEEGMLTVPETDYGAGYILIPRLGIDNYSQINEVCQNIFSLPPQTDINPVKQYTRPKATVNEETDKKSKKKTKNSEDTVKGVSDSKDKKN